MSLFENIGKRTENRFDHNNLFVKKDQLQMEGSDLIKKLPSTCVSCKENTAYQVLITKIQGPASYGFGGVELKYMIKCTNCDEVYDILDSDYSLIKPFLKLNEKLICDKITPEEYDNKNKKHINKLVKKKKKLNKYGI